MRILIGIIAFIVWALIGTQWYVCGIKGLCGETIAKTEVSDTLQDLKANVIIAEVPEKDSIETKATIEKLTIYFPFAKSEAVLTTGIKDSLKTFAKESSKLKVTVSIKGHTDNIGSDAQNMELGKQRAEWVWGILADYGLDRKQVQIVSKGEGLPLANNSTKSGRSKNRRVEISTNP